MQCKSVPLDISRDAVYEIEEDGKTKSITCEEIVEFGLSVFVDYFYRVKAVVLKKK